MCGITGYFAQSARPEPEAARAITTAMADRLLHRGPDDSGVWVDVPEGVGLGFRRLSIIDLSPAGHQPMVAASGQSVLAYNGEIYNAEDLRPELAARGVRFRGHSDSEVMLEAFEAFGVAAVMPRLTGMFAFAYWDARARTLTLGRDRLGEKPLYLGRFGGTWLFGSELKALRAHPAFEAKLDPEAALRFLRHHYVPQPAAIYAGVEAVRPGTVVVLDAAGGRRDAVYWDAHAVATAGIARRAAAFDAAEAETCLDHLLRDAVRRCMAADVPLGAFLSGGIDSSTVVAMMQAQSTTRVKTFTIGFDEDGFDEAQHARAVATHLGTEHTELRCSAADALALVPQLPEIYDEPFADSSQIPTLLVSGLARRHVTVALSGDGGDELFAGYTRYPAGLQAWRALAGVPRPLRRGLARGIEAIPSRLRGSLAAVLPARAGRLLRADRVDRVTALLRLASGRSLYRDMISQGDPYLRNTWGRADIPAPVWAEDGLAGVASLLDWMQLVDTLTYLPDDILTKVDRASMSVSLEARVPLLDHRVVAFAWGLPQNQKLAGGIGKVLLRNVLARYLPRTLFERPKMGFGIPTDAWLRGPLRDWAADLLSPAAVGDTGILAPAWIGTQWERQQAGASLGEALWGPLMLQSWCRHWGVRRA